MWVVPCHVSDTLYFFCCFLYCVSEMFPYTIKYCTGLLFKERSYLNFSKQIICFSRSVKDRKKLVHNCEYFLAAFAKLFNNDKV